MDILWEYDFRSHYLIVIISGDNKDRRRFKSATTIHYAKEGIGIGDINNTIDDLPVGFKKVRVFTECLGPVVVKFMAELRAVSDQERNVLRLDVVLKHADTETLDLFEVTKNLKRVHIHASSGISGESVSKLLNSLRCDSIHMYMPNCDDLRVVGSLVSRKVVLAYELLWGVYKEGIQFEKFVNMTNELFVSRGNRILPHIKMVAHGEHKEFDSDVRKHADSSPFKLKIKRWKRSNKLSWSFVATFANTFKHPIVWSQKSSKFHDITINSQ